MKGHMDIMVSLKDLAKQILIKDRYVAQMVFFITNDQIINMSPVDSIVETIKKNAKVSDYDFKILCWITVGIFAKTIKCEKVILIIDAAMRSTKNLSDSLDPTERPLTYPKSMRTECIILDEVDLKTGTDRYMMVPYKGGDGDPVQFLENEVTDIDKIESIFTEFVMKGYKEDFDFMGHGKK
jgi:hypothetical protein